MRQLGGAFGVAIAGAAFAAAGGYPTASAFSDGATAAFAVAAVIALAGAAVAALLPGRRARSLEQDAPAGHQHQGHDQHGRQPGQVPAGDRPVPGEQAVRQ